MLGKFRGGDTSHKHSHIFCSVSVIYPEYSTDSCSEDSGGPVNLIRKARQALQIEITSFVVEACKEDGGASWYIRARRFR